VTTKQGGAVVSNKSGPKVKYTDEVADKLLDFFNQPLFAELNGKMMPTFLPTIEKFCADIKIAKSTFYAWVKEYPKLSNAFDMAKQVQKDKLINLTLLGFYKEGFAKFVAINITDMRDERNLSHDISENVKRLVIQTDE
jgi:hypothetical protein